MLKKFLDNQRIIFHIWTFQNGEHVGEHCFPHATSDSAMHFAWCTQWIDPMERLCPTELSMMMAMGHGQYSSPQPHVATEHSQHG